MTVSVTASAVQCLGTVSSGAPATISFAPTSSAQLLVVAVCWQSAATYAPPTVSFAQEVMILQSTHAIDTSVGAIALYILPLSSPATGNVVIQPSGFLGNTQVSIAAYAGTSQSLGVVVTDEYGTSSAGVNTGTTTFSGITAGSVTTLVGATFFGGTPSSIVVTGTGWSSQGSATATNEGVFTAKNTTGSGSLSVTYTDGGSSFWTMMVLGYEVLAGSPPSPGASVTIQATATACLGTISSAVPGSTTFIPGSAADFIVAAVGWSSSSPLNLPSVTVNGAPMQPVSSPVMQDAGFGAIALFVLIVTTPITGTATVVVNSAPNFLGLTSIVLYSFSGDGHLLGITITDEYGTNSAGVFTGTTSLPGVSSGSALMFVGMTFFGTAPPSLTRNAGWAADGTAAATNQSAFAFHNRSSFPGNYSITLSNATTAFNLFCFGFEVLLVGAVPPSSTVTITNSGLYDLGAIGDTPGVVTFDASGASLLMLVAAKTNNVITGPANYTFGGVPFAFVPALSVINTTTGTTMDVAFIANPPSGSQQLIGEGVTGYFGYTEIAVIALASLSGVVGVASAQLANGNGLNMALAASNPTSLMVAVVSTIFPKATEVPNYGWTTLHQDMSDPSINAWIFSSIGGATKNLLLTGTGFAGIASIVLEFTVVITATPNKTGAGVAVQKHVVSAGTVTDLGKLTPSGQDLHVYWESFWDNDQFTDPSFMKGDDFYLAKVPSYVGTVMLSFATPLFTYASLSDNITATTGLNFPGDGHLLLSILTLLRSRNPTVKVLVALQQLGNNEPYSPTGWGGMTSTNIASIAKFISDLGLAGIVIDYEVVSSIQDAAHHCTRNSDGTVTCYTDTELLATIKALRTGLPRPITIILDGLHVGAYGVGAYAHAPPDGYNSGYNVCVANDSVATAALDAIHVMTYDSGATYDPRTAVESYRAIFPTMPLYIGIRVGPPQYQDVKQTSDQILDYCNTVIMLNMAGAHMYSGMWDVVQLLQNGPDVAPFGDYDLNFPDGNIAAQLAATVFNLGNSPPPSGTGYTGPAKNMRLDNKPAGKSPGVGGSFF